MSPYEETQNARLLKAAAGVDTNARRVVTEYLVAEAALREAEAEIERIAGNLKYWTDSRDRARTDAVKARAEMRALLGETP